MAEAKAVDQVEIEHWGSPRYGGDAHQHAGMTFTAEVDDQRESGGRLMVSIADDNGDVDDRLDVAFEITDMAGSSATVAVMMLYDGDDAVAKLVKHPNGHLIVPMKPGVQIVASRLPNGDACWMLLAP